MMDNNLKNAREELEMTQKEMGYILGIDESTVRGWELSKDIIPLRHLIKISNAYNLSIDYLLGFKRKTILYDKIPKINNNKIGNSLKLIRLKLGYTQSKFADELEISQSAYSNYEIGKNVITTFVLYTLAKKFKISIDELLERKKK